MPLKCAMPSGRCRGFEFFHFENASGGQGSRTQALGSAPGPRRAGAGGQGPGRPESNDFPRTPSFGSAMRMGRSGRVPATMTLSAFFSRHLESAVQRPSPQSRRPHGQPRWGSKGVTPLAGSRGGAPGGGPGGKAPWPPEAFSSADGHCKVQPQRVVTKHVCQRTGKNAL